ncbi:hypothetical protein MTX20_32600 [Bradyrhizobium sp. ISRA435]|nr:hypothetical protein MTX20_32600 [Bradyrhizobium sp. ISRA435]
MSRSLTIVTIAVGLSLHAAGAATVAITTDDLDAGIAEETRLGGNGRAAIERTGDFRSCCCPAAGAGAAAERQPAMGDSARSIVGDARSSDLLAVTAAAAGGRLGAGGGAATPAAAEKEIRPPPLSLVGTIASDDESFGIFLDQSTKQALRLKLGENYQGWKLRAIQSREVTMEMDQQTAILTLPPPGEHANVPVLVTPVSADGSTPQAELRRR